MGQVSLLHLVLWYLVHRCILTEAQSTLPGPTPTAPETTTLASGFIDLPNSVDILESARPRSVVLEFRIQSPNPDPIVKIVSFTPDSRVFETPIVSRTNTSNIFIVQIVLNGTLDFETVGLHSVRLALVTTGGDVEQTLHVHVIDVNEPPHCPPLFQLPGAQVQVPEGLPAPLSVYTILAFDPDQNDTLSFSIIETQPDSSKGQFLIYGTGKVISKKSFDYQYGPREFLLSVLVSDRQGANCSGTVQITVLRVFLPPLDFIVQSQNISILENGAAGDHVAIVRANTTAPDVQYTFLTSYPPYKIGRESGIITTTFTLDLESDRSLDRTVLLVRAFSVSERRSGTATVTVNVLDVNEHDPFCLPSLFVLTVPETTEIGKSLGTLTCHDIDVNNLSVSLSLEDNDASRYMFRLRDGQLQVNGSLDYDRAIIAGNDFQYEATIRATDSGNPARTSQSSIPVLQLSFIPVMITVTPVNEWDPVFEVPFEFLVREDAPVGSVVGTVKARDLDWRFDALRYSIPGGNALFSVHPVGGQLYLKRSLDFEDKEEYSLTVQAVDFEQDADPAVQRTGTAEITIGVQNVNDNPPICDPFSYETTIFSTRSAGSPILTLSCTDRDRDLNFLAATITNGAAVSRFQINGLTLSSRNAFSYVPGAVYDPTMFEVTIAVSDGKHTTDVVAYIHVVPWSTTAPTTTTTTTPKPPQVVTVVQEIWDPDPWFVAVLTITGALLLLSLGLLIWKILTWTSVCVASDPEASDDLLKNTHSDEDPKKVNSQDAAIQNYQSSLDGTIDLSKENLHESLMRFDGKAEDPVSGRSYLFNSRTGERRWL